MYRHGPYPVGFVCKLRPQTLGVQLALFAGDTCMYSTGSKEIYVLRKLQRGLTAMDAWCDRWNIRINEAGTHFIYFYYQRGPVEAHITLKGRNIPFVKVVKYLVFLT
jgi:hypothetical protein